MKSKNHCLHVAWGLYLDCMSIDGGNQYPDQTPKMPEY